MKLKPAFGEVAVGKYWAETHSVDFQIKVGVIIGKAGETIRYLQLQSGAKIQVTRDNEAEPGAQTRPVELSGSPEQISKAEQLIKEVLAEADAGSSGTGSGGRKYNAPQPGAETFQMKIANNKVGLVIGKGGETMKSMQAKSRARIQVAFGWRDEVERNHFIPHIQRLVGGMR